MLEKIILRLEQLQARLHRNREQKRRERTLRCAKSEINRLARMRLL